MSAVTSLLQRLVNALRSRLSPLGNFHNWHGGPVDRIAARLRRPADRAYMARVASLDEHASLADSVSAAVEGSKPGTRVLVCALRGWPDHNAYEGVIAQALRLRGCEVALLTCGGGMPMSEVGSPRTAYPRPCDRCGWLTDRVAEASGLKQYRLADLFPWGGDSRAAPPTATGERAPDNAARVSAIWSLRTSDIPSHSEGERVLNDYQVVSTSVFDAASKVLDDFKPDSVFMVNGMFAAEQAIGAAASARGIRTATYEIAPRGGALVFAQEGIAPALDLDKIWDHWKDVPLSPEQEAALDTLLGRRSEGRGAHEPYNFEQSADGAALRAKVGLPADAQIASLFANIAWDTALQDNDIVYGSMIDFIVDAIERIADTPDLHLVIRSHPAEVKWGSNQPIEPEVRARLSSIPANVRFVGPEQTLNSYELVRNSRFVLSYATTVGLEASVEGVPVVVAADVHYRDRGFTTDIKRPNELSAIFQTPPAPITAEQLEIARRYAFAFFFRVMVSFPAVERTATGAASLPTTAEAIAPGADPYLDFICDCILTGRDFDPPSELVDQAAALTVAS